MKLSISKCSRCNRARLVDNVAGRWICFACKQKMGRVALAELQGKLSSFSEKPVKTPKVASPIKVEVGK